MTTSRYPTYGAEQVWTFVRLRGHVLPVVASDDQYCVRLPDGSTLWVEKWDCQPASSLLAPRTAEDVDGMKLAAARRGLGRNLASSTFEVDRAFERNSGRFED